MEIEFDAAKSEMNRVSRGFSFGYAARVFLGRTLVSFARVTEGEIRMKAIGEIDGRLFTLIFVDQDGARRIISARPSSRKERTECRE